CEAGPGTGSHSGVVYRIDVNGAYTTLAALDGPTWGPLVEVGGMLYGTTSRGGSQGGGSLFRMTFAGQVTVLHTFDSCCFGAPMFPTGALLPANDGYLYGNAQNGGWFRAGGLFRVCYRPEGCAAGTVLVDTFETFYRFHDGPQLPMAGV